MSATDRHEVPGLPVSPALTGWRAAFPAVPGRGVAPVGVPAATDGGAGRVRLAGTAGIRPARQAPASPRTPATPTPCPQAAARLAPPDGAARSRARQRPSAPRR